MDQDTKNWLEQQHDKDWPAGKVADRQWFEAARRKGIKSGHICEFTTAEGMRSHIRQRIKKAMDVKS
jgi:hypothetical protein